MRLLMLVILVAGCVGAEEAPKEGEDELLSGVMLQL
jgi:hypothetical protein